MYLIHLIFCSRVKVEKHFSEKVLDITKQLPIFALPNRIRRVGQGVKTPPFHGGITGSIPVRATKASFSAGFFNALKWSHRHTLERLPILLKILSVLHQSLNFDLSCTFIHQYFKVKIFIPNCELSNEVFYLAMLS